jgi:hypothetical protein
LTARKVESGSIFGDDVSIVSGLNPGERYISRITGKETEGTLKLLWFRSTLDYPRIYRMGIRFAFLLEKMQVI